MPTQQEIYQAGLLGLITGLANTASDEETAVGVDTHIRHPWEETAPILTRIRATPEALDERIRHMGPGWFSEIEALHEAATRFMLRYVALFPPPVQKPVPEPEPIPEPIPEPEPSTVWDRLDEDP